MDAAEYKHIVLGLIFLKYISDSFKELHSKLSNDKLSDAEDKDEQEPPFKYEEIITPEGHREHMPMETVTDKINKLLKN
jgi:type I restriction-modification system DNA methylase subunit